ncbi:MAG: DUF5681 domain-containing protein [Alphaproteobacteria bacterium]
MRLKLKKKAGCRVGYKNPPKHTQFKPGASGNPKGRPKGTKNLKTDLSEELSERIPVKIDGKEKRISKQRAILKALIAKAAHGDPRAINIVLATTMRLLGDEEPESAAEELAPEDLDILDQFAEEVLASAKKRGAKSCR